MWKQNNNTDEANNCSVWSVDQTRVPMAVSSPLPPPSVSPLSPVVFLPPFLSLTVHHYISPSLPFSLSLSLCLLSTILFPFCLAPALFFHLCLHISVLTYIISSPSCPHHLCLVFFPEPPPPPPFLLSKHHSSHFLITDKKRVTGAVGWRPLYVSKASASLIRL